MQSAFAIRILWRTSYRASVEISLPSLLFKASPTSVQAGASATLLEGIVKLFGAEDEDSASLGLATVELTSPVVALLAPIDGREGPSIDVLRTGVGDSGAASVAGVAVEGLELLECEV